MNTEKKTERFETTNHRFAHVVDSMEESGIVLTNIQKSILFRELEQLCKQVCWDVMDEMNIAVNRVNQKNRKNPEP